MGQFHHFAIVGPTASGKSALALDLARSSPRFEIVSADSMQVYKGMNIGTAKASVQEQSEVRHHVIDLLDPTQGFSVGEFQKVATEVINEIESRDHVAIVVGGTGLYVHALINGLKPPRSYPEIRAELEADDDTEKLYRELQLADPVAASNMIANNRRRIVRALEVVRGSGQRFSDAGDGVASFGSTTFRLIGLWRTREELGRLIERRYDLQMRNGFLDEVSTLAKMNLSRTARQALGYRELLSHLEGEVSLEEALTTAVSRTKSFARRQRMWFRRDPRITWLGVAGEVDQLGVAIGKEWQSWLN